MCRFTCGQLMGNNPSFSQPKWHRIKASLPSKKHPVLLLTLAIWRLIKSSSLMIKKRSLSRTNAMIGGSKIVWSKSLSRFWDDCSRFSPRFHKKIWTQTLQTLHKTQQVSSSWMILEPQDTTKTYVWIRPWVLILLDLPRVIQTFLNRALEHLEPAYGATLPLIRMLCSFLFHQFWSFESLAFFFVAHGIDIFSTGVHSFVPRGQLVVVELASWLLTWYLVVWCNMLCYDM